MDMPKESPRRGRAPLPLPDAVALVLQGGGALGSFQAGVAESLARLSIEIDWVAGISIGAINAAIIAGNRPERRVERLTRFWETVSGGHAQCHAAERRPSPRSGASGRGRDGGRLGRAGLLPSQSDAELVRIRWIERRALLL